MTVGILGDISLPVIEIIPTGSKFYDYRAKYAPGGSKHIVPAKIPRETSKYLQSLARKAFDALGCRAVARVDFRLDRNGNPYLLEVNTIPGMTGTSLLPESAKVVNIDFKEMALRIIEYSCWS
jgi:D-alanine-D-alanine ligase